jgi:DNA-binding response OmpR family regulator
MKSPDAERALVSPLVLIVDDDKDTRDMYTVFLDISGFRVISAADADSAFEQAMANGPNVVVTDFMLRGAATGADLCRRLKQHERTAHVPALLVTGSTRKSDAEDALGAGCADIRIKPYHLDELLRDVRALTDGSASRASVL